MATWRKALVFVLVLLIGVFPVFARMNAGWDVTTVTNQQVSVPLPSGNEMQDDELIQAEGEGVVLVAFLAFCFGAAFGAWFQQYEDEDYGVDWDDAPAIVATGMLTMVGVILGIYAY